MDYYSIAKRLSLDSGKDLESARVLDGLLKERNRENGLKRLFSAIKGKNVVVFGAGPSLKKDIKEIKRKMLHKERSFAFIAADGSAKALAEEGLRPQIQVTDLDGYLDVLLKLDTEGTITVVHAHGDNIELIKNVVPKFSMPIGTTQTPEFGSLNNFGGFTDGDRAVFLAERFNPKLIILAGMDFGEKIGEYSGRYDKEKKTMKLKIGKELIEDLAKRSKTVIVNMTSGGADIRNVPRIDAEQLRVLTT